jgi:hypothetical protein
LPVLALIGLLACGGDGAAGQEQAPLRPARRAAPRVADSVAPAAAAEELRREVFSYRGGGRDPFESLLTATVIGPELVDLTLVGIYLDHTSPARSVVVLRERITGRRYLLHPGDRLGRLTVASVREREVDFLIDDFGTERLETLALRRRQEDSTP